jgi:hypothetical protein
MRKPKEGEKRDEKAVRGREKGCGSRRRERRGMRKPEEVEKRDEEARRGREGG